MTTNLRKSTNRLFLLLMWAVISSSMLISCGGEKGHGEGVWIPLEKDSSELGMRDHFMPKDSIEVYRKRFDLIRDTLAIKEPSLFIPFSEGFNKKSMTELLKDPKCIGLRIYYGATAINSKGKQDFRLIVVGVDKDGNDLFVSRSATGDGKVRDGGEGGFEYGQCTPPCEEGGAK